MNSKENLTEIINQLTKTIEGKSDSTAQITDNTIFECMRVEELEKIISQIDDNKKAQIIEILKTIK